eukprot:CAMPEP_0174746926 /NCGR_PEP_ID=MMETSP1094-20130205/90135_1 /TAXON_ID=156173 /ORGANISM="Chrysochromulina brevifilum, Strain UTEX LB 985" /LENGTH=105 /DNA_ID=CAMNT_0015951723 /DNA_START=131 /DNA_END=449 /DNA_ORIENTATION=-
MTGVDMAVEVEACLFTVQHHDVLRVPTLRASTRTVFGGERVPGATPGPTSLLSATPTAASTASMRLSTASMRLSTSSMRLSTACTLATRLSIAGCIAFMTTAATR